MTLRDLPEAYWPLLWSWMQETPDQNLDDDSPTTVQGFIAELSMRLAAGEKLYGAYRPNQSTPVGAVGCLIVSPSECWLHGICVDPQHQRQGIGTAMLNALEYAGTTMMASYYADNVAVGRLFARQGYQVLGVFPDLVTRRGQPVHLNFVAKYVTRKESVCHSVAC